MIPDRARDQFVYPGQLVAARAPVVIKTILGSCIAVVLMDRKAGVLGLCHYLLDRPSGSGHPGYKYGIHAIPALIREMQLFGATISDLEAQIFGGANLSHQLALFHQDIGKSNAALAHQFMKEYGIRVTHEDTGGTAGRNIRVNSDGYQVSNQTIERQDGSGGISRTGVQNITPPTSASVLIVDDSQTARAVIERALARNPAIKIAGTASDAFDARDKIVRLKPDVLLLDIEMPRLNGVDFLEKLMEYHPMPVIMVSSLNPDGRAARRALELGAIEFVQKPSQYDPAQLRDLSETLPQKILAAAASRGKLKSARPSHAGSPSSNKVSRPETRQIATRQRHGSAVDLICVSGNVGSLGSLESLLAGLEDDSPPVVLAVSTISAIPAAFIEKVRDQTRLSIVLTDHPQVMGRGKVYFTDASHHAVVEPGPGGFLQIRPVPGTPVQGQRPSGDVLMISAAKTCPGSTCGIMLGGFGKDGVRGLSMISEAGGMTIVEDPATASFPHNLNSALEEGVAEKTTAAAEMAAAVFERRSGTGA